MQDGLLPAKELRDRGIFATRQLAKRQLTWLRSMENLTDEAIERFGDLRESSLKTARAWAMKERFKRGMMSLADSVQLAVSVGRDRRRKPIILADGADNPGGGGRGNTTYLLRALKMAGARGVVLGARETRMFFLTPYSRRV